MNKRLFTFGDSFTKYAWPMWSDILAQNFEITHNLGNPGSGNTCILSYFIFAIDYYKIKKSDVVIIQWSEPKRVDYIDCELDSYDWKGLGRSTTEEFIKKKLTNYINDHTTCLNHLTQMNIAIDLLEKLKCEWYFMYLNSESVSHKTAENLHYHNHLDIQKNFLINKINSYADRIIDISMCDFIFDNNLTNIKKVYSNYKSKRTIYEDDHPAPSVSFQFIKNLLAKKMLNIDLIQMEKYANCMNDILFDEGSVIDPNNLYDKIHNTSINNQFKIPLHGIHDLGKNL